MGYVVYFDLIDAKENKIHPTTCQHYRKRKRDASTTKWSREFESKDEAIRETGVSIEAQGCVDSGAAWMKV